LYGSIRTWLSSQIDFRGFAGGAGRATVPNYHHVGSHHLGKGERDKEHDPADVGLVHGNEPVGPARQAFHGDVGFEFVFAPRAYIMPSGRKDVGGDFTAEVAYDPVCHFTPP